jgi:hypothetical protein
LLQLFTVCPIVESHPCPVHLGCFPSGTGHVLNPEQHRPALLTMVVVSKLAKFGNVRESVALGLDFYLNKNDFKQGAFKGGSVQEHVLSELSTSFSRHYCSAGKFSD